MITALTRAERDALLRRRTEALAVHEAAMTSAGAAAPWSHAEAEALAAADAAWRNAADVEAAYFEGLPRVAMGCCPFDGKPLVRSIDPYGLDGPWWNPGACSHEPVPCPHFCVLLGALGPVAAASRRGGFDLWPGPQKPFVVPRLLAMPSMTAVLAEHRFEGLPLVYTVAYFAQPRPLPEQLTAAWPRSNFVYTTQVLVDGWRPAGEDLDFDLVPWLAGAQLRWCEPGTDNSRLVEAPAKRCPFAGLEGHAAPGLLLGLPP
jgi:hypothetical protein